MMLRLKHLDGTQFRATLNQYVGWDRWAWISEICADEFGCFPEEIDLEPEGDAEFITARGQRVGMIQEDFGWRAL